MPLEALPVVAPNHSGGSPTHHKRGIPMVVYGMFEKRPPAPPAVASLLFPPYFRRIYRAFVQPRRWPDIELTAFVEASGHQLAIHRIAAAIAALEYGSTVESVSERIYNCASAIECLAQGLSENRELRIFETRSPSAVRERSPPRRRWVRRNAEAGAYRRGTLTGEAR
jgi:hypothetical protein